MVIKHAGLKAVLDRIGIDRLVVFLFFIVFLSVFMYLFLHEPSQQAKSSMSKTSVTADYLVEQAEKEALPVFRRPLAVKLHDELTNLHPLRPPPEFTLGSQSKIRVYRHEASRIDIKAKNGFATRDKHPMRALKAGTMIPAVLLTGISSDIPGMVVGQVSRNIYDSQTGEQLLVPQGSKVVGRYDSQISQGQNRVKVSWNELLLPHQQSVALDGALGIDLLGVSGFHDSVDYHTSSKIGASMLSSGLRYGNDLLSSYDVGRFVTFGEQASSLGNDYITRLLNRSPTIIIHAGYAFRILLTKDVNLG